jgi:hydrogenase maturation protease
VTALVLGLGDVLHHDEAIGVWVAERLARRYRFPADLAILEGSIGLDLLPRLEGIARLLLIDAVAIGAKPGSIVRLQGEEVPAILDVKSSPHRVGARDLLGTARLLGREPPLVVLWGMEPGRLDPGVGFSAAVAGGLAELEDRVLAELALWGFPAEPGGDQVPMPSWWAGPGTRRSVGAPLG